MSAGPHCLQRLCGRICSASSSVWWLQTLLALWQRHSSLGLHLHMALSAGFASSYFLMSKLKLQYFGHLMRRTDSLEKTLMRERLKAGREGDDRGWDGWMASPTQWTLGVLDREAWCAAVHGVATDQLNWPELNFLYYTRTVIIGFKAHLNNPAWSQFVYICRDPFPSKMLFPIGSWY